MRRIGTAGLEVAAAFITTLSIGHAQQPAAPLAPAVAVEAEDFKVEAGWKAIREGEGNYAADAIGFSHISGERLLHAAGADTNASAYLDVNAPVAGAYRLWVRYEYMPFTETRFQAAVEQGGKVVAAKIMGSKTSPKTCPWSDGTQLEPQYDPPWGNEGLTEEPLDVPALAAGPARLRLLCVAQPEIPGVTANRNIDCLYLTSDTRDTWRQQPAYKAWYGILNAIRDTRGARYEAQFTNRGEKPARFTIRHVYNRLPWYLSEPSTSLTDVPPGASTAWVPLSLQDTAHFSLTWFAPGAAQPFTVAVRPAGGGAVEETVVSPGDPAGIYLPPYPGKGEQVRNVLTLLDEAIAALKAAPAPGQVPTRPLCYGDWMPFEQDNAYGRKYAQLFAALGMRNTGAWSGGAPVDMAQHMKNLQAAGLQLTRSGGCGAYRFPPTPENIARAKEAMTKSGALDTMRWYDYGDEIGFGEWFGYMVAEKKKTGGQTNLTVEAMILPLWQQWLAQHRPGYKAADYWRPAWGTLAASRLRPDASAEAAVERPRLYVDSVIFYEDVSIGYVAEGAQAVKKAFGDQVLSGCNYSCYPYYYPHLPMYSKWFRMGAADFGRHSEYFWELGQVTPMINGYVAEHFRIGMRFNPKAILRQYTMPHSPGNTDADFLRTAFTHLAHGARNLDFFGIGFNETFTENYIDARDNRRRIALRDVTHALALVEDLLETSQVVPSEVALLVSDSTERWDHSKIANDHLTPGQPARNFRDDRLTYHQERVGLYEALTFAGASPDLVIEEDLLNPAIMKGYKVLFVVGDCLPLDAVDALEKWIKRGGVLCATAGVGRYGTYREPNPALQTLVGIQARRLEERDTFMRTSQELPFLKPVGQVVLKDGQFPALAVHERIKPADGTRVVATFADDQSPAVIARDLDKGEVVYVAALPGLAYLYTGLTTPTIWVPDRDPGVHRSVTTYDRVAASLILQPLATAGVRPRVKTTPDYIDTRLLAGQDAFILPLANYNEKVGGPVTVTIQPPAGAGKPKSAVSAYCGKLKITTDDNGWTFTLPKLGYGDIVRIAMK